MNRHSQTGDMFDMMNFETTSPAPPPAPESAHATSLSSAGSILKKFEVGLDDPDAASGNLVSMLPNISYMAPERAALSG